MIESSGHGFPKRAGAMDDRFHRYDAVEGSFELVELRS